MPYICPMESTRQQKIAKQLQKDLADILGGVGRNHFRGVIFSVTKVRVTPDLGLAKIYISLFPTDNIDEIMAFIRTNQAFIRNELAQLVKNQVRKIPELHFYVDDSLDYQENIERLLRGEGENPIV